MVTILRRDEVCKAIGRGPTSLWRLMQEGRFPRPVRLGPGNKSVGWLSTEVEDWIEARKRERDGAAAA